MASTTAASIEHIEATPGVIGGKPRIKGTRIGVHDVKIWYLEHGRSVEDIAEGHDLAPAHVHAALAYYFDHQQEVDRQIREEDEWVAEFMKRHPSGSRVPADG